MKLYCIVRKSDGRLYRTDKMGLDFWETGDIAYFSWPVLEKLGATERTDIEIVPAETVEVA